MAQLISSIGTYLFYIGALSYAQKVDNGGILVTLFTLSETLPTMFLVFTGYFSDKTPEKVKPVILLTVFKGILFLLIAVLLGVSINLNIIILICFLNFVSGIANEFAQSLLSPLPKVFLKEDELDVGLSLCSATLQLGNFFGQIIGSVLVLYISLAYISVINSLSFFFESILYISVFTLLTKLEFKSNLKVKKIKINIKNLVKIVTNVLKKKDISILIINFSLLNILLASIVPYLTIFLNRFPKLIPLGLKFSIFLVIVNISISVFFIIGTHFSVKLREHINGLTMAGFIAGFLVYFSLFLKVMNLSLIFIVLTYFIVGMINPYIAKKILMSTDNGISTVQGVFNTFLNIGSVFGSLIINLLSTFSVKFGCYFVFLIVAIYFIIYIFIYLKGYKD